MSVYGLWSIALVICIYIRGIHGVDGVKITIYLMHSDVLIVILTILLDGTLIGRKLL